MITSIETWKKVAPLLVGGAACAFIAFACARQPENRIGVTVTDSSNSELKQIVVKSWMKTTDALAGELRGGLREYIDIHECSNAECFEGFGFTSCVADEQSYRCEYATEISVRHSPVSAHVAGMDIIHLRTRSTIE